MVIAIGTNIAVPPQSNGIIPRTVVSDWFFQLACEQLYNQYWP
jgi:hypothetical protein